MEIDKDGPVPIYRQIADLLREQITGGQIPPGRPIPSKATISQEYDVAGNTVEHAFRILKAEGLVIGMQGKRLYVAPAGDWRPGT